MLKKIGNIKIKGICKYGQVLFLTFFTKAFLICIAMAWLFFKLWIANILDPNFGLMSLLILCIPNIMI